MGGRGRPSGKNKKRAGGGPPAPGGYSTFSEEDQEKTRVGRGNEPFKIASREDQGRRDSTPRPPGPGRTPGPGRPPLDEEKGAMDQETLRERKRKLSKEMYKKNKISETRRDAVNTRKDRRVKVGEEPGQSQESPAGDPLASANPDLLPELNETADEATEDLVEGEKGPQPKTISRRKKEFFDLLPSKITHQCKVLKTLVGDFKINEVLVDKNISVDDVPDRSTVYRQKVKIAEFLLFCHNKYGLRPSFILLDWVKRLARESEECFLVKISCQGRSGSRR